MRPDPAYRKITAEEFLAIDFGTDRRFELEDGVIVMMAGGTEPHAWVQGNLFVWLRTRLRGSRCRPYGPDMAVRINEHEIRYPDASIFCDLPPREELTETRALPNPTVIFEVLSPSTSTLDQGTKQELYRTIDSVRTIVFIDPVNEMVRTVERAGPESWIESVFSGARDVDIPTLDLVIPRDEIFARD